MALLLFVAVWLWLWSTPLWANFMCRKLESQNIWRPANEYPVADAIVVLGGGIRGNAGKSMPSLDLGAAADRELFAAQLYHEGKSKVVIVSAGLDLISGTGVAGLGMKQFLVMLGVPSGAIRVEPFSKNTIENAREVQRMMQVVKGRSILLVTSAMHMPRARWIFGRTGLLVIPAPADFEAVKLPFSLNLILPDAQAMGASTNAAKEIIGLWITKLGNP